jgi:hypothetical protein
MFEQEFRSREQISREAAERFAIMVAIAQRKAAAKPARRQRRGVRKARASVAKPAFKQG